MVDDSVKRDGDKLRFRIRDRDGTQSVPVVYSGVVPDPFREGREVIVSGELEQRHIRRRARLARDQVPVEVHEGRAPRREPMAGVGSACLAVGLLTARLRGAARRSAARARGAATGSPPGRRAIYCLAALLRARRSRSSRPPSCARTSRYKLVAEGSSTDTPTFYKVTAVWATQDGSLLLWVDPAGAVLERGAVPHAPLAARDRALGDRRARRGGGLLPAADGGLGEPVRHARASPPAEGAGLNPLLRHPAMMIHPPMLYTGYVGFSIPFAFAIGALITRRTGADWIRATRRFALIAWTFLGTGILLGALWSYSELGWGGYWAWDPVENASLMPWLWAPRSSTRSWCRRSAGC